MLGTRNGEERERPNPFTSLPEKPLKAIDPARAGEDVVTLPLTEGRPALPRNVSIVGDDTERSLGDIARKLQDFDPGRFAQGAQDAFAIIVEAFAAGDRETLKNLLEPSVFAAFDGAIAAREQRGETCSTEIHAVRRLEILSAKNDGKTAYITVRIVADETCVVRDKDNAVLSGDPERITEMNDIWTFSRALKSREPIWFLHETRDGDVKEEQKTPIPDSV